MLVTFNSGQRGVDLATALEDMGAAFRAMEEGKKRDDNFAKANHRHALEQAEAAQRAATAQIARHGPVAFADPPPPSPPPGPHVAVIEPSPTSLLAVPWQDRLGAAKLPIYDMAEARASLARAIAERTEVATALGDAKAALDRADGLISEISAALAAQAERDDARATELAERTRLWLEAGGEGQRPEAGLPAPQGTRNAAELQGARVARQGLADDHAAANAAFNRAAEAVQQAVRGVLKAEGAALASQVRAAENALARLRSELRATLRLPEGAPMQDTGDPVLALVMDAEYDRAAEARWADYSHRLSTDENAQIGD